MKCPYCNYVSFDYLEACRKCSKDLTNHKSKFGIDFLEPKSLGQMAYAVGSAVASVADVASSTQDAFGTDDFNLEAFAEEETASAVESSADESADENFSSDQLSVDIATQEESTLQVDLDDSAVALDSPPEIEEFSADVEPLTDIEPESEVDMGVLSDIGDAQTDSAAEDRFAEDEQITGEISIDTGQTEEISLSLDNGSAAGDDTNLEIPADVEPATDDITMESAAPAGSDEDVRAFEDVVTADSNLDSPDTDITLSDDISDDTEITEDFGLNLGDTEDLTLSPGDETGLSLNTEYSVTDGSDGQGDTTLDPGDLLLSVGDDNLMMDQITFEEDDSPDMADGETDGLAALSDGEFEDIDLGLDDDKSLGKDDDNGGLDFDVNESDLKL